MFNFLKLLYAFCNCWHNYDLSQLSLLYIVTLVFNVFGINQANVVWMLFLNTYKACLRSRKKSKTKISREMQKKCRERIYIGGGEGYICRALLWLFLRAFLAFSLMRCLEIQQSDTTCNANCSKEYTFFLWPLKRLKMNFVLIGSANQLID